MPVDGLDISYPAKTIRVPYDHWHDLVRLVAPQSNRLSSENVGRTGNHVRLFAAAIQRGLDEAQLDGPLHDAAVRVLDFVGGPGRDGSV